MNYNINITCDKCKGEFFSGDIKLEKDNSKDGIPNTFFKCPHCNYICYVIKVNKQIEELEEKQRQLINSVKESGLVMTTKQIELWQSRQAKIKELIEELNKEW